LVQWFYFFLGCFLRFDFVSCFSSYFADALFANFKRVIIIQNADFFWLD